MSTDAGFLNDLGLDNVEADPNFLAEKEQHPGFVFDSKVVTKKDNSKSWVITYKVAPESKRAGVMQDEWYSLSVATDGGLVAPSEQQKSYLKKRALSLGVPEAQIKTFDPKDVIGTPVFFSVRHRNGYQNVADVTLRDESTGQATPAGGSAPEQAAPANAVSNLL